MPTLASGQGQSTVAEFDVQPGAVQPNLDLQVGGAGDGLSGAALDGDLLDERTEPGRPFRRNPGGECHLPHGATGHGHGGGLGQPELGLDATAVRIRHRSGPGTTVRSPPETASPHVPVRTEELGFGRNAVGVPAEPGRSQAVTGQPTTPGRMSAAIGRARKLPPVSCTFEHPPSGRM